jgi:hypothetical protein
MNSHAATNVKKRPEAGGSILNVNPRENGNPVVFWTPASVGVTNWPMASALIPARLTFRLDVFSHLLQSLGRLI